MRNKFMFKNAITAFIAGIILFSCTVTAFAAEVHLNEEQPTQEIGVYVKYVDNIVRNDIPTDGNGNGTITLPDGTEIEVNGTDSTKGQLVIDLITEKDALDWIGGIVNGKAKDTVAYHIYYVDEGGDMKSAKGITVTVKPKTAMQNTVGYTVNSDGKVKDLTIKADNGSITFTANGDPYYVFGEKITPTVKPGNGAPQTGDNSNMMLWFILLMVSGGMLVGTVVYGKKKKYNVQN